MPLMISLLGRYDHHWGLVVRIVLVATGSRGDAQPLVVLGAELGRRGHQVVLGVSPNLVAFGRNAGLATFPVGPDSRQFLESPDGQRWLAAGDVMAPMRPTGAYPNMLITIGRLPRRRNLATHSMFQRLYWRNMAQDINNFRVSLGLAPVTTPTATRLAAAGTLELQAYHHALVPALPTTLRIGRSSGS